MIQKLAHYVTLRMVKENIILYQQAPNYEYEFVMRVENMLTAFSILAVALHIKMFGPSVVFLLFFLNLRKVTGGYHAETFLRCFIMSNIIFWCITQIVYPFLLQKELMLTLAITTLSFVLIFVLGVVNNSNWNLESNEYLQMKTFARKMVCKEYFLFLLCLIYKIEKKYIVFMSIGIVLCAITLIMAKVCKQEIKVEV